MCRGLFVLVNSSVTIVGFVNDLSKNSLRYDRTLSLKQMLQELTEIGVGGEKKVE